MPATAALLKRFHVLQHLPEAILEELAEQAVIKKAARREIVIQGGNADDRLCFLFEGRLQGVDFTLDGREVGLYFIEPGDFCGELGLFDQQGQPESVISLTKSHLVLLPRQAVFHVLRNHYPLVEQLFSRMAGRIRQLSAQRALLGVPSITARVCGQLWMILQAQNPRPGDEPVILNPPTHQELAIMLNLSRETVTRVFQKLQSRKIVQRDGASRLLILLPEDLQALAQSEDSD